MAASPGLHRWYLQQQDTTYLKIWRRRDRYIQTVSRQSVSHGRPVGCRLPSTPTPQAPAHRAPRPRHGSPKAGGTGTVDSRSCWHSSVGTTTSSRGWAGLVVPVGPHLAGVMSSTWQQPTVLCDVGTVPHCAWTWVSSSALGTPFTSTHSTVI